ncbi:S-layer homology domain-containing protein [Paenibacillus solani]|uniref:SLH domain-containing protein n=1 Tax=Paenibacillus solani TaxID=1705565 RepID=A0A0M1N2H4_9BACL|nr:S-layer homology domain-containing protein [Paenibacillus solani]KOR76346.1 hypothetical protein AM231_27435 [Paenibacillus solani]
MAKRAFIILALIVSLLLSGLFIPVKDQASAFQMQAETIGSIQYDPRGGGGILHYYSDGKTVKYLANLNNVPADAKWVTFMPLESLHGGNEFYFSLDGITTERKQIDFTYYSELPAEARWFTISNFDGAFGEKKAIHNQQYTYSVDGVNVLSGPEVPANALWTTLSHYTTTWGGEDKTLNYVNSRVPYKMNVDLVQDVSIHSDGLNPIYAKEGTEVTLSFTSLPLLQNPIVTLAGQTVPVVSTAGGVEWKGHVTLNALHSEGEVPFTITYQDDADTKTVMATTDGSSVIFDRTPPEIDLALSTTDWTKDSVAVRGQARDTGSGVEIQKWEQGIKDASYFRNNGNSVAGDAFQAGSNGWYTWYAKDCAGNEAVRTIEIQNIDRMPPSLILESAPKGWTSAPVQISVSAEDIGSGVKVVKWTPGKQSESFFQNGGGTAITNTFEVTSNGIYTVYAEDQMGNGVTEEIMIQNLDTRPPDIRLTSSPILPTQGEVMITADFSDDDSGVETRKWSKGQREADYFLNAGTELNGASFMVDDNGFYTVYAKDHAGNEHVQSIEISNIYKIGSSVKLSLASSDWASKPMDVQVEVTDNGSGIAVQKWAAGHQPVAYFNTGGTPFAGTSFSVNDNGEYSVYIKDNAGYEEVATIKVVNLDTEKPIIADPVLLPNTWTNGEVSVTVTVQDNSDIISMQKWSEGEQTEAFFRNGGGTAFSGGFIVHDNGAYTVYAEDAAGNGAVRTFYVSTIDKEIPDIQLRSSIEQPTNQNVTVTADVYNTRSPIVTMKWASGERALSYFETEGHNFNQSFEVELNGWYTVYAESAAGNKGIGIMEIKNIYKEVPVIQLTSSPSVPTQGVVTVTASVYAPIPLIERKLAMGQKETAYFHTEGDAWTEQLEIFENGWVSYYVRDQAGNETVKQLEITNIDHEKPVITLLGESVIILTQHTAFMDPGATAHDNLDGDLTNRIQVTGKVDVATAGEYRLRYSVTDRAGNEAEEAIRTVIVRPRQEEGGHPNPSEPSSPSPDSGSSPSVPPVIDKEEQKEASGSKEFPPDPEDPPAKVQPPQPLLGMEMPAITDISGHWAEPEIRWLYEKGLLQGYPDGTFRPKQPVTRAEFITLLVRCLELEEQGSIKFSDTAGHWADQAIRTAVANGLAEGYSNLVFGPNDRITREQMAVMLARASQLTGVSFGTVTDKPSFKDQDSISVWAVDQVSAVVESKLLKGYPDGRFLPQGFATRAETAAVIYRLMELLERDE